MSEIHTVIIEAKGKIHAYRDFKATAASFGNNASVKTYFVAIEVLEIVVKLAEAVIQRDLK